MSSKKITKACTAAMIIMMSAQVLPIYAQTGENAAAAITGSAVPAETADKNDGNKAGEKSAAKDRSVPAAESGGKVSDTEEASAPVTEDADGDDENNEPPISEKRLESEIGRSASSTIWGGVTPSGRTGWITFHALVPSTVHDNVYLVVMNVKTLNTYGVILSEYNDYAQMVCLPSGMYVVVTGGLVSQDPASDDANLFFFEPEQVQVEAGVSSLFSVRLHDNDNPTRRDYSDLEGVISEEEAASQSEKLLEQESGSGEMDERDNSSIYKSEEPEADVPVPTNPIEDNRDDAEKQHTWTWWQILLFTALLALIPVVILIVFVKKHGNLSFKIDR